MLSFIPVDSNRKIIEIFNQIDQSRQSWVVSNLKTKKDLQNELIFRDHFCFDDSLLRVSEFWSIWLRRIAPHIQIVDRQFINAILENFLTRKKNELALTDSEIKSAIGYFWQLTPMLLHFESENLILEWFDKGDKVSPKTNFSATKGNWKKWYLLSKLSAKYLIEELGIIHRTWCADYLQNADLSLVVWGKELFFDLGPDMTAVELSIFQRISTKNKITILVPENSLNIKYSSLLRSYQDVFKKVNTKDNSEKVEDLRKTQYIRFSSPLAEIQWVVKQVKEWINQGIDPRHICLSSPQVEYYWPILKIYLAKNNIPADKDIVVAVSTVKSIQFLISRLKLSTGQISWTVFEQFLSSNANFTKELEVKNKFSEIQSLFSQVTELNELESLIDYLPRLKLDLSQENQVFNRKQICLFVIATYLELDLDDHSNAKALIREILSQSIEYELNFSQWMKYIESIVAKMEQTLSAADPGGVRIRSTSETLSFSISHKINFGCDALALRPQNQLLIPREDLIELKRDFEYSIDTSEEHHFQYNLDWSILQKHESQVVTMSEFNFIGEINETPFIFIQNNFIQLSENQNLENKSTQEAIELYKKIDSIFVRSTFEKINNFNSTTFSASGLSKYDQCPFVYYLENGLQFHNQDEVALDIGARTKGQIFHALFDWLSKENFAVSNEKIEFFFQEQRKAFGIYFTQDSIWSHFKNKLIKSAKLFCSLEIDRGSLHFERHSEVAFEVDLKPIHLKLRGRIDRFDVEPEDRSAILFDYKSSHASVSQPKNWIRNSEFQFLVYLLALEEPEMKHIFKITQVKNAQYYVFKDFKISKGFKDTGEKDQIVSEFGQFLKEFYARLQTKTFQAEPKEAKNCKSCHWNQTCRAKHLS